MSGNRPHLARLCAFGLPGAVLPAFSCTAHTARSRLGTTSDSKGPTESRVGRHDNRGTERSSSPHERATAILAPRAARFRRRSAGAIQNEPASRTARTVCGDASERDARLGTLRQLQRAPMLCPTGSLTLAPRPPGRPRSVRVKQRVKESQEGTLRPSIRRSLAYRARAGLRSSRSSARHQHGRRLSAPTQGTSVPLPGPQGLLMMAIPHRREATWRTPTVLHGATLRRACATHSRLSS